VIDVPLRVYDAPVHRASKEKRRPSKEKRRPSKEKRLRPPLVVTFSLASLTPCCNGTSQAEAPDEKATVDVPIEPSRAPVSTHAPAPQPSPAPAPSASAPDPKATEPWPFEKRAEVLNPKHGDKRVLWDGKSCFVFGREKEEWSGIQFDRHAVPCPNGIETLLASCRGRVLERTSATTCQCVHIEGNPPPMPDSVKCP
jgi:hypothetical protein